MAEWIGINRRARRCYGFDEVALVPGAQTVNPNEVDTSFKFNGKNFKIPILAAAMDGVVDVKFAIEMSRLGGIAVLNLDGIQTRYENADEVLEEISKATPQKATELIQAVYTTAIKEKLVTQRIAEIKKAKAMAVVSCIPANAERFSKLVLVFSSHTIIAPSFFNSSICDPPFSKIIPKMIILQIIFNCFKYSVSFKLIAINIFLDFFSCILFNS